MHALRLFPACGGAAFVFVLGLGGLLVLFRRIEALARTPMLDVILALLTWVPWAAAAAVGGFAGLIGCFVGQAVALYVWCFVHELMHPAARSGPRIIKFIDRLVGPWRNHVTLWVTVLALPIFLGIRFGEVTFYWALVWLLKFPNYRQAEWVNVSRQKFSGLVGHDLIWCLYCDWMTGVYSLGAEMLRNVESFWCPIRFYEGKKCENCKLDFPDLQNGWVAADGNMADVERVLQAKYADGQRAWFGHPARLTVNGKPTDTIEEKS